MQLGKSRRRATATLSLAALALICAAAAAPAMAAQGGAGDLSARLTELAQPAVRAAPPARQAKRLSLAAEGPGSLLREGNRVLVEVRFDHGAAASVDDLRAAGAKVLNVSPRYQTVTVAAKPSELPRLSGVPRVSAATEVLTPFTSESTCPSGEVVSEGEQRLHAGEETGEAREVFGIDGTGVTVGVLSDSFNQATEAADGSGEIATRQSDDVAAGDLPGFANTCPGEGTPVEILDDSESEGEDEGRAMAQIVHDLAPGADLAFATAFSGETAFAENIETLAKSPAEGGAGAQVVVDDVSYPGEPFFQEGPIAVAVKNATEDGATYFSSAGNNSLLDASGREIGSWETGSYRNSGGCPPALQAFPELHANACLDFNPGSSVDKTLGIEVPAGATLTADLQWNEPWHDVNTDLDAFLLDANGGLIAASAEANPERPLEFFQWENETASPRTVQLVINRYAGGLPRLKLAFLENGSKEGKWGLEYPHSSGPVVGEPATDVVGPTVFGHNGAAAAMTVGAVPFDNNEAVEKYSSRGPVTHYFGPVAGSTPAPELGAPEELSKPEVAATDCGKTSFFASEPISEPGVWRFCGTSAAAPHAAAVAALMDEAKAEATPLEPATPAEVRAALLSSAVTVGAVGECGVGAGLVEAVGAVKDLLAPPSPVEPECEAPLAEVLPGDAQATGSWGVEAPPAEPASPPAQPSQPSQPPNPPEPEPETDTTAPATFFRHHPRRVVRTRGRTATVVFRLGSNEAGSIYFCRVDANPTKRCPALLRRRYRVGAHVLHAWARDAAGNTDRSAAVFHFRVKRVRSLRLTRRGGAVRQHQAHHRRGE